MIVYYYLRLCDKATVLSMTGVRLCDEIRGCVSDGYDGICGRRPLVGMLTPLTRNGCKGSLTKPTLCGTYGGMTSDG